MPIRGSFKDLLAAMKSPYAKRFGQFTNTSWIDHDMDNNYDLSWSTADGLSSIEGMRVDSNNNIRVGYNVYRSSPKPIRFLMKLNAEIVTQCIFIADQAYEVVTAQEMHSTAGTDSGAVTLDITKDTSGVAPGAGTSLLSSTFSLKATANTVQAVSRASNPNTIQIAAGDRISVKVSGVTTSLAGVEVTLYLSPGHNGDSAVFNMNTNAQIATQAFYTANKNMKIASVYYVHSTAGTNGSAVNIQVTKDTGTTAPGAGTALLTNNSSNGFDAKGTINVIQTGALTATAANLRLAPGDRLSFKTTGTLTSLAGVVLVVNFVPYNSTIDVTWTMNANSSIATQTFFYANRAYRVIYAQEAHATAGTDAGSVNLNITVDRETDAPGAGSPILSNNTNAGFNLKGTANTVQTGTFISEGIAYLLPGDRLSVSTAGVLTTLAGVQVTVTLIAV